MFRSIILLACLASTFASDVENKSEFNKSELILNTFNNTNENKDIKLLNVSTILVTGGNRGIGLEFVRQLASLEPKISHIIVTCRNPDAAKELKSIAKANNNVHILKLDIIDYNSHDAFYAEVEKIVNGSGLDLLINNAGIAIHTLLDETTPEEFMKNFEINTVGTFMLTRKLTPLIKVSQKKLIVYISSTAGSIERANASFAYPAYKASKAALNIVSRTYADHIKKDGVTSVIFDPGWVKTDLGGPDAPLDKAFSVASMIKIISTVNATNNGCFFDYEGKTVPW